jgi:uncharacterized protein
MLDLMRAVFVSVVLVAIVISGCDRNPSSKRAKPSAKEAAAAISDMEDAVNLNKPHLLDRAMANGADPDFVMLDGTTFLHAAVGMGRAECARVLLKNGASVHIADQKGQMPLHKATYYSSCDPVVVEMLLAAGANPSLSDGAGKTALDYAVANGHEACAAVLRKAASTRPGR